MFVQDGPRQQNMYTLDGFLQRSLGRLVPKEALEEMTPDLTRFGERVSMDIWKLGRDQRALLLTQIVQNP